MPLYPPAIATPVSVPNGGTGDTSVAAYSVVTGGTTNTSPLQTVASLGTSGQVLTSNGPAALPTFQTSGGGTVTFSGFGAHLTTNTSSAGEIITYDATDFNTGTQYNTSTGVWTVPTTGYWSITMGFGYTSQTTLPAGQSIFGLWTGSQVLVVGEVLISPAVSTASGYTGTTVFHLTSGSTYQFIDGSARLNTWGGGTVLTNDGSTSVCYATASFLGS